MVWKVMQWAIAPILVGSSFLMGGTALSQPISQSISCPGDMGNGWRFTADHVDGRFIHIIWERTGQVAQVTNLSFYANNALGQPIYRGTLFSAVNVTLVDLSRGFVQPGTEVSIGVDEWGWARGICGDLPSGGSGSVTTETLRQELLGLEIVSAGDWLRQNGFVFIQTIEHTETRLIERWVRQGTNQSFDVIAIERIVSDVVQSSR